MSGLLAAWETMVSMTGLIILWLYIFGCVAVEIITSDSSLRDNPETALLVEENFGSLSRSTLTLLQFVTMAGHNTEH